MERESTVDAHGVMDTWKKKHRLLYTAATRHPFILSIRDGTVDITCYKRWLGQDYIFVRAFVPFMAIVLVKGWKASEENSDLDTILGGLAYLDEEIAWFKKEAMKLGILLSGVIPQKANEDYCGMQSVATLSTIEAEYIALREIVKEAIWLNGFLENLMSPEVEYAVAIAAAWTIEAVYQESFAHCLEGGSCAPPELKETCERWGNDDFGQYCRSLQRIAGRNLGKAGAAVLEKAEAAFVRVLELEVEFWNMSNEEAT